jgi:hypothetical protein
MEDAGQAAIYALRLCAYLGREDLARFVLDRPARDATRPALCLAHLGRLDEARVALERSRQAIDESLGGEVSLGAHVIRLEAAVLLADRDLAAQILPRVADCEHLLAGAYYDSTCVARHLGAAAALLGDPEAARRYTERAIAVSSAVRHRPEIALSRLQLAELVLAEAVSHRPSAISGEQSAISRSSTPAGGGAGQQMADKLKAERSAHLDFAIAEFRAMKMQPALERALRHKGLLSA